jgi:hypothetical protein
MKRALLLILIASGCGGSKASPAPTSTPSNTSNTVAGNCARHGGGVSKSETFTESCKYWGEVGQAKPDGPGAIKYDCCWATAEAACKNVINACGVKECSFNPEPTAPAKVTCPESDAITGGLVQ